MTERPTISSSLWIRLSLLSVEPYELTLQRSSPFVLSDKSLVLASASRLSERLRLRILQQHSSSQSELHGQLITWWLKGGKFFPISSWLTVFSRRSWGVCWTGVIVGEAMTPDLCDQCWGLMMGVVSDMTRWVGSVTTRWAGSVTDILVVKYLNNDIECQ